jgi:hypothetical protein
MSIVSGIDVFRGKSTKNADIALGEDWDGPDQTQDSARSSRRKRRGLVSINRSPLARKIITFNLIAIIILTLVFFYTHSMLWFWRELKSRPYEWVTVDGKRFRVRAKRVKHDSGKHFRRFSWQWRVNHWSLALSVMTLTLTGMVVMFPQAPWAVFTIELLGGTTNFGYVHRTAAVIFLLAVLGQAIVGLFNGIRGTQSSFKSYFRKYSRRNFKFISS